MGQDASCRWTGNQCHLPHRPPIRWSVAASSVDLTARKMLCDHKLKNERRHQHVSSSLRRHAGYRGRSVSHNSCRHSGRCLVGYQELRAQVCRAGLRGTRWQQRGLVGLFRPAPGRHDKVHRLEDARDGRVRYLSLQRASIIAMRVQGVTPTPASQKPSGVRTVVFNGRPFQTRYPDVFSSSSYSSDDDSLAISRICASTMLFTEGFAPTSYLMPGNRSPKYCSSC